MSVSAPSLSENARRVLEARYLRRDAHGAISETPEQLFARVARAIAHAELVLGNAAQAAFWEEQFYTLLTSLDFLPNSPTLMNAGTLLGQLSACFVLPIEDTLESIFQAVRDMALVQRSGGGTGFSFARLRPAGDVLSSTGGTASGPVSFIGGRVKPRALALGIEAASLRLTRTSVLKYTLYMGNSSRRSLSRWTCNVSPAWIDAFPPLADVHRWSKSSKQVRMLERPARLRCRIGTEMLTRKAFKYRLYPTPKQEQTLLFVLRRCRHLYNSALEERKAFYQMRRKSLGYTAQAAELAEIKAAYPAYQDIHSQVLQDVLRRLDKAFSAFFRRLRNGEKPSYPRFQGQGRFDSFTYPQSGFALAGLSGSGSNRYACLALSKIGDLKVRVHRPMEGQVKTCMIKRDVNHWYATFSCEVEDEPLPSCEEAVGIDMGLLHFATLSTGETIENPRHYRKGLKRIKLLSQVKDRRKKGSHRRKRAAIALAKAHRKVRNQRKDFQQKAARALVNRFGLLVFEDLKITNMSAAPAPKPDPDHPGEYLPNGAAAKAGLNQSILDAGWGQFQQYCVAKAASAGRRVLFVDPRMTSQLCSGCGQVVRKELDERWHSCECGTELDRDHNSAKIILFRGLEEAHRGTPL